MGPYPSEWICGQNAHMWPSSASECFTYEGQVYFYGMRQNGQGPG